MEWGSNYLGTEHSNPKNVESLSPDIFRTHVNNAFQTEPCTNSSSGDAMLTGTRFGNDTLLSKSFG